MILLFRTQFYIEMPTLIKALKHRSVPREKINWYNNSKWIRLRNQKRMDNPLCQICELKGKSKLVNDVHHIVPITNGQNEQEQKMLAYDYDNLCSLCTECHHEVHQMLLDNSEEYYLLFSKFI